MLRAEERDADAGPAGAARAADAVDVALAVGRRVEVDDVRDAVDVDAAGGDVGRDERVDAPGLERGERLLALALRLVAVHRDGVDAPAREPADEAVGAALGAHEDERPLAVLGLELVDQRVEPVVALDRQEAVLDVRDALLRRRVLVALGVAGVGAGDLAGLAVERGREEQGLALGAGTGRRCGRRRAGSPCRACGRPRRARACWTCSSVKARRWIRSSSRPGVATTMWARRASRVCFSNPTPP